MERQITILNDKLPHGYRTLTLARLGKANEARECLAKYLATDATTSYIAYVQIQVPACLGDFEQVSAELESAVTASGQDIDDLYNVVCAGALSSRALSAKDAAQSARFADRTFELLRHMIVQGYNKSDQLNFDPDFASLRADPRFLKLLSALELPASYAALWRTPGSAPPTDRFTRKKMPRSARLTARRCLS